MPNLEMTKKEKEDLVAKVTDAVFAGVLNRMDAIAILDICSQLELRKRAVKKL